MDNNNAKLPIFRLSQAGFEKLMEAIKEESRQRGEHVTKTEVICRILESYAKKPYPLVDEVKSKREYGPIVSAETARVIEEQANQADISVGSAIRQIVEDHLLEESAYLQAVRMGLEGDTQ